MEYHLVRRLEDGRRQAVGKYETREEAEAHRDVLIAREPRHANALVILEEDDDERDIADG